MSNSNLNLGEFFNPKDSTSALRYLDLAEELVLYGGKSEPGYKLASAVLSMILKSNTFDQILQELFLRDIERCPGTVFREFNTAILVLKSLGKLTGFEEVVRVWLQDTLSPKLSNKAGWSDLDSQVSLLMISLQSAVGNFIMTNQGRLFARSFSILADQSAVVRGLKTSSSETSSKSLRFITSVLFLRFVSPVILQPQEHLWYSEPISADQKNMLISLTKVIQKTANYSETQSKKSRSVKKSMLNIMKLLVQIGRVPLDPSIKPNLHVNNPQEVVSQFKLSLTEPDLLKWVPEHHLITGLVVDETKSSAIRHFIERVQHHQMVTYGMILSPLDPMLLIPELYDALWCAQYEIAAVISQVTPLSKELIQATVSVTNQCQLCVDLHSTAAIGLGLPFPLVSRLVRGKSVDRRASPFFSPELFHMIDWARVSNRADHPFILSPRFPLDQAPEVFGAAFLKHVFNRTTSTFLKEFTQAKGKFLKALSIKKKSRSIRVANSSAQRSPGDSLRRSIFLPTAPFSVLGASAHHRSNVVGSGSLSVSAEEKSCSSTSVATDLSHEESSLSSFDEDSGDKEKSSLHIPELNLEDRTNELDPRLHWALSSPFIAEALYRWQVIVHELGQETLPPLVRAKLRAALDSWNGVDLPSTEELRSCEDLPDSEATMARFLITFAKNPTRISSFMLDQFRRRFPEKIASQCVIGACEYAAFVASCRIASFWKLPSMPSPESSSFQGSSTQFEGQPSWSEASISQFLPTDRSPSAFIQPTRSSPSVLDASLPSISVETVGSNAKPPAYRLCISEARDVMTFECFTCSPNISLKITEESYLISIDMEILPWSKTTNSPSVMVNGKALTSTEPKMIEVSSSIPEGSFVFRIKHCSSKGYVIKSPPGAIKIEFTLI